MSFWPEIRALAWLKRAALALERIAAAQEIIAKGVIASLAPRPRPSPTQFEEFDLRAAERDWLERQRIEADEAGEPPETDA